MLLLLIWTLRRQGVEISVLQYQVADTQYKVANLMKVTSDTPQAECALRASNRLKQDGLANLPDRVYTGFDSHYNRQLGKCYVLIHKYEEFATTLYVSEPETGQKVADFKGGSSRQAKEPEVCEITLPSGQKQACHSEAEFKSLSSLYMKG